MNEFAGLLPGAEIEIGVDSPSLAFLWSYILKRANKPPWKERIKNLESAFDPEKFDPLYFCCEHKRLKDGTHRLFLAKKIGMKTIKVKAHAACFRRRLAESDVHLLSLIQANKTSHRLDGGWLAACRNKKWIHLRTAVNYKGATVLDIGSQCGYTCIEAMKEGAVSALGIEKRADMVELSKKAVSLLKLSQFISFRQGDWLTMAPIEIRFDIVHCLGLLHYFPAALYRNAVEKMMAVTNRILVLEMKLIAGPGIGLKTIGIQTLTTHEWLESVLSVGGFEVKFKFPVVGDKRQLWICEKKK